MADPKKPDVGALLAAPPGAGGQQSPIGVPKGYTAQVPNPDQFGPGVPLPIPARYFDGDEWQPATLAPEKIAALQRGLATAGLIGATQKFRLGLWDEVTRNAYRDLLAYANSRGTDDTTALHEYAAAPRPEGALPEPLVKKIPNPADLRATFDTVAKATLGRQADSVDRDAMVAAYQAAVASAQQQAYDLDAAGGTIEEPPSAEVFAKEELRRRNPAEAGAHDVADQFGGFEQMLGGING